jgi:hypothetical protein
MQELQSREVWLVALFLLLDLLGLGHLAFELLLLVLASSSLHSLDQLVACRCFGLTARLLVVFLASTKHVVFVWYTE